MQTIWLSPAEYVTGDPSLKIEYPFVRHPNTIVTCTSPGDLKWLSMGLPLPADTSIEEVTLYYQVSSARSYISQLRLTEITTPNQAFVRHDDPTDLRSTSPTCYSSAISKFVPVAAVTLELRLNFADTSDRIMLGAVAFKIRQTRLTSELSVEDFGAVGDDSHDDTTAIQNALDALKAQPNPFGRSPSELYFPPGMYRVTRPLVWNRGFGSHLRGAGKWNSYIRWDGPTGNPMLKAYNCRDCIIERLSIIGNISNPPAIGIEVQGDSTDTDAPYGSTGMIFRDLLVGGHAPSAISRGVVFDIKPSSVDQGNDFAFFERVDISNCIDADVTIENSQSKGHQFIDCEFGGSQRGIWTTSVYGGGSFSWYGGFMWNHNVADFDLGTPNDAISIVNLNSEGCNRLLLAAGDTGNTWPTTFLGCRIACNSLNPDYILVDCRNLGPLNFIGCTFGEGGQQIPKFRFSFCEAGSASFIGNSFNCAGADQVEEIILASGGPWNIIRQGNLYRTATALVLSKHNTQFSGIQGISGTGTAANNLSGTVDISGTIPSIPVTFPNLEVDAQYQIFLSVGAKVGVPVAGALKASWSNKSHAGFTVNLEEPPGVGNTVTIDWVLTR